MLFNLLVIGMVHALTNGNSVLLLFLLALALPFLIIYTARSFKKAPTSHFFGLICIGTFALLYSGYIVYLATR